MSDNMRKRIVDDKKNCIITGYDHLDEGFTMTITMAFFPESYPILMGDVLLSGPERKDDVYIPTIGNIHNTFPKGSGYSIVGLKQKLCILNDKLAVGWAGTYVIAKTVINELKNAASNRNFSIADVMSFWDHDLGQQDRDQIALIGFIKNHEMVHSFGFNYQKFQSERFGHVMLSGSGAQSIASSLNRLGKSPEFPSEINKLEKAVCTALCVSGDLLGQELITKEGLLQYFGGGVELVSLVKGRLTKIGNTTYLLWLLIADEDGNIIFTTPKNALKFTYHNDLLLVRTAEFNSSENALKFKCNDSRVHIIDSLLSTTEINSETDLPIPSFNSRWTLHYVVIHRSSGNFDLRYIVDYIANDGYKFHFVEDRDLIIKLEYSEAFLRQLHSAVFDEL